MKNNYIYLLIIGLFSLLAASCIDDKGNYEYEDPANILPATISGINDTTIMYNAVLKIVPEIHGADNGDYAYNWNVTPSVTAGRLPEKTVLSEERILNVVVPAKVGIGTFFLTFEVRDKKTNLYVRKQVLLTLTATNINTGWYILKDINDETDFDYISRDGSTQIPDVLLTRATPAARIKGTAVQMVYQQTRYYHTVTNTLGVVTTLANQQVFHILSSRDIKTYNAANFELFKNYEDQFYSLPPNCNPQSIRYPAQGSGDLFLLNDGKIHAIYGMSGNIGKYPAPKVGLYSMHKDMIAPSFSNALYFDMVTCTFYSVSSNGYSINKLSEESASAPTPIGISPTNMNYTLLNLLPGGDMNTSIRAFAVMQNKTTNDYYLVGILSQYSPATAYPFTSFNIIPAGNKMPLAAVKAAPYSGDFVYFGDNNKLCVYKNIDIPNREQVLITFDAGETVSYIQHMYSLANNYNWLAVLTNSASGWKLYVYNVIGVGISEIDNTPIQTYSGTGNARSLIYR